MKINKKQLFKHILYFWHDQKFVLFFSLMMFIKLWIFGAFVIDVRWSNSYVNSVFCNLFISILLFSPLLFINKYKKTFTIILSFLLTSLIFIDTIYYSYFSAIPSIGIIGLINSTDEVSSSVLELLKLRYLLFYFDILIVAIFNKRISSLFSNNAHSLKITKTKKCKINLAFVSLTIIFLILSILLSGKNTLGEVYNKSYDSVSTAQYYGLFITHIIDSVRFIDQETTKLSENEIVELVDWIKQHQPGQSLSSLNGIAKNKNVILVQVESLASLVIDQHVNDKQITPNLNKLISSSHYFPDNRFIIGAGHSSDTDLVVNTSYFPIDSSATLVRYGSSDFSSLAKLFNNNGYSTNAYHGFVKNFWSRDVAYKSFGYNRFYSSSDYPDGTKLNIGLNDGDFFDISADYIKSQPKPSLSTLITLSSHTPFEINNLTQELGLNPTDLPNQVAGYLENINYVDRSFGSFLNELKENDLYDSALIVIYGDHTPVLPAFSVGTINYDPYSNQSLTTPIIIKLPNQTVGDAHYNRGTNLDIMPTVLDLVDIKTNQLMFGSSLFYQIENSVETCPDQIIVFAGLGDCNNARLDEENISSKIIRYNQFKNISTDKTTE